MKKKTIIISIAVGAAILITIPFLRKKDDTTYKLNTVMATKGRVINSVTATGTVEPIEQVEVGTQVSGVIHKIHVDFNSVVKRGQLLAELDKSTLMARALQSRASLASSKNEHTYQLQNFNRIKALYESELVSETDYEGALYKLNNAKASLDRLVSEVDQAEVNLSYATIYSPIDGVVLDRTVEEGQTVAASFNTPTLFTIARDLTRMQVEADVDEADIGQVALGQHVTFMVDAYPEDEFIGSVSQIRLKPSVTSNVVTYVVIIEAPNPDLKLKPGLTANITIVTREETAFITLPVTALSYQPGAELEKLYTIEKPGADAPSGVKPGEAPSKTNGKDLQKTVWVKNGKMLAPRIVETGLTDRTLIAISKGLTEGDTVVVSTETISSTAKEKVARSPFMPSGPSRR